jgi:hypothetical protein
VSQSQYLYGTNEFVYIAYDDGSPMMLSDVMEIFRDPKMKVTLEDGEKLDFICARKLVMPVNKENCLKYGIVPEKFADEIPDAITLTISKDKKYVSKPEIFLLDLLSSYNWDRPLSVLNMGGDLNVGIKDYMLYDGFSYRFTPIRNKITSSDAGKVDALELYDKMKNVYTWDALKRTDYFADYQNQYTFQGVLGQRQLYVTVANALIDIEEDEKAIEMMDLLQENFPESQFPLESIPLGFAANDYMVAQLIENYYFLGAAEKARPLATRMCEALLETAGFYLEWGTLGSREFETASRVLLYIADVCKQYGDKDLGDAMVDSLEAILKTAAGSGYGLEHADSTAVE